MSSSGIPPPNKFSRTRLGAPRFIQIPDLLGGGGLYNQNPPLIVRVPFSYFSALIRRPPKEKKGTTGVPRNPKMNPPTVLMPRGLGFRRGSGFRVYSRGLGTPVEIISSAKYWDSMQQKLKIIFSNLEVYRV